MPKEQAKRTALVETIGADGYALLEAIYTIPELNWLAHVPAVEILRQVWVQQFELIEGQAHFRANDNIPPPPKMICSPYDVQATYGRKLTTWWVGYKVHLTETCDENSPRLITHVETSRAGNGDVDVTPVIHQALKEKDLLPTEHLTDTNYAEAKQFVQSRQQYGIDLIAPTRADHKWQAKEQQGFDSSRFHIDWDAEKATCPAGCASLSWTPAIDQYDNEVIKIKFSMKDCKPCQLKEHCTKASRRAISVRVKQHHQALQEARARQKGAEFREKYRSRAGIEGTISKAGSRLWFASQSLPGHGENALPAPRDCNGYQFSTNPRLVGRRATGQNAYIEIRRFSFGCLNLQVRQQYHIWGTPPAYI